MRTPNHKTENGPDPTAVRTALWRALHLLVDSPPHVLEDDIGLRLIAPDDGWRNRPDMHPEGTRGYRASIVARARFVEDLAIEESARGVEQYVLLGAGLDTFAQRRADLTKKARVFEIDRPGAQAWKKQRLVELGFRVPDHLTFVPVDFEAGHSWREELAKAGLDAKKPAVVVSTGVSMYLTKEANLATLRDAAAFTKGSTFVMSFLQPIQLAESSARSGLEQSAKGARASGTPFISFFTTDDVLAMAREAGFPEATHVSAASLGERYFSGRLDGLRPPTNGEELLVATT